MVITRRQFGKYAIGFGISAASTIMIQGCRGCRTSPDDLPLCINLIGPMAFKAAGNTVEVRLPNLSYMEHQAGIVTPATGIILDPGAYSITGPSSQTSSDTPYPAKDQVYLTNQPLDPNNAPVILLTLPKPKLMVVLDPVKCKVYPKGTDSQSLQGSSLFAVGLRFLYERAGTPQLSGKTTKDGKYFSEPIPIDPSPEDKELNISVIYAPFDTSDRCHCESTHSFNELSHLFQNLDLAVEFEDGDNCPKDPATCAEKHLGLLHPIDVRTRLAQRLGPVQDCKAPVIMSQ